MNVCSSSPRQHPVLWAMAGLCAGVQWEEVTLLRCSLAPVVDPRAATRAGGEGGSVCVHLRRWPFSLPVPASPGHL